MKRLSVLGLVVVVLVGGVALLGPAVVSAQSGNVSNPVAEEGNFTEAQFVITVFENGSARFTQRYNQPLSNDTEVRRFRAYADRFNGEETPLYTDFKERAMALTAAGSNATGREMNARGFTKQTRVVAQPTTTGVVEMSFVWTNFTTVEDGRIVVGNTFENGFYLSPGMALTIEAGENLEIAWKSVEPQPDASSNGSANATDSLTYFGEQQFASGHPRVAFVPESAVVVNGSPMPGPIIWVAGALVLVLVVGAVVVRRSDTPFGSGDEPTTATDTAEATETVDATDTASTAETDEEAPTEPAVTDADLRSDEDRITTLLEEHGGRMQQSAIVEETGWSKSKVSMLLSEMEDAGQISKLRIGRENVVSLAGHEPEAAGSPFEDG